MEDDKAKSQQQLGAVPPTRMGKFLSLHHQSRADAAASQPDTPARTHMNEPDGLYRVFVPGTNASTRGASGSTSPPPTWGGVPYPAPNIQRQPAVGQQRSPTTYAPDESPETTTFPTPSNSDRPGHSNREQSMTRFAPSAAAARAIQNPYDAPTRTQTRDHRGAGNRPSTDSHAPGAQYVHGSYRVFFGGRGPARQEQRSSFGSNDSNTRPTVSSADDMQSLSRGVMASSLYDSTAPAEASNAGVMGPSWGFNPATGDWPPDPTGDQHGSLGFPTSVSLVQGRHGSAVSGRATQPQQNGTPSVLATTQTAMNRAAAYGPSQPAFHLPTATPSQFPSFNKTLNLSFDSARNIAAYGQGAQDQSFQRQPLLQPQGVRARHHGHRHGGYDAADTTDSRVLREYKAQLLPSTNTRPFDRTGYCTTTTLRDIQGHVVEFSTDKEGSKFVQAELLKANSDEVEGVFGEIIGDAVSLMTDYFGNYVMSKLFVHATMAQKTALAEKMMDRMPHLAKDPHGCRVVQTALDYVLHNQHVALVRKLEPDVPMLMKHDQAHHVLNKAIDTGREADLDFIFRTIHGRFKELACNQYACRVIQKAAKFDRVRAAIVDEVVPLVVPLTQDQYGNYVVGHMVEYGSDEDRARIINGLLGHIVRLSRQKHASNVVEKCIINGTPEQRLKLQAEMLATGSDGRSWLCTMVVDSYANYVVQNQLRMTPDQRAFIQALRSALPAPQWAQPRAPPTSGMGYGANNATGKSKHLEAIRKLMVDTERELAAQGQATPSSRGSRRSSLQLDSGSAVPTPNLTREPNSPSSSSPDPSMTDTPTPLDDMFNMTNKPPVSPANGRRHSPEVNIAEPDSEGSP